MIENIDDVLNILERLSKNARYDYEKNEIIDCINVIKQTYEPYSTMFEIREKIDSALHRIDNSKAEIDEAIGCLESIKLVE